MYESSRWELEAATLLFFTLFWIAVRGADRMAEFLFPSHDMDEVSPHNVLVYPKEDFIW